MDILEKIVLQKKQEVAHAKALTSISVLENTLGFKQKTNSLKASLLAENSTGIIAEFKRQSPSKGVINADVSVVEVTTGYASAGAAGLSVLTDTPFFGGSQADFLAARAANPSVPMLRKDFIIDEYQIIEAKAWGADVILLIAACLSPQEIAHFASVAKALGMEVLLEVHDHAELHRSLCDGLDVVGVNNRNLRTFEVSVDTSLALRADIPAEFLAISESGLADMATLHTLKNAGYRGFLIGETFMKTTDPAAALRQFLQA